MSVPPSMSYVFVSAFILLNNLRNLFIICINVDNNKMLLFEKNKGLLSIRHHSERRFFAWHYIFNENILF